MSQSQRFAPRVRFAAVSLALGAALAIGACTGAASTPAPTTAASQAAVDVAAEIDATVAGLEEALTKYRAGDKQGALDAIAETYEKHFELVEGPLDEVDHDFMENLEELVAIKTRAVIQDGKPVAELEALVTEAKTLLAQAKEMLT